LPRPSPPQETAAFDGALVASDTSPISSLPIIGPPELSWHGTSESALSWHRHLACVWVKPRPDGSVTASLSTPFQKYLRVFQPQHSLTVVALNGAARVKQSGFSIRFSHKYREYRHSQLNTRVAFIRPHRYRRIRAPVCYTTREGRIFPGVPCSLKSEYFVCGTPTLPLVAARVAVKPISTAPRAHFRLCTPHACKYVHFRSRLGLYGKNACATDILIGE